MKNLIIFFNNLKKYLILGKNIQWNIRWQIFDFMKTIDTNIDKLMNNLGVTNEKNLSQNLA